MNITDPEPPSTLERVAKKAHEFFVTELQPLGYELHAQIKQLSPGGMPAEVGLYPKR